MFKCSCGYETENGNSFSAHFKHYKGDEHKRLGWADPVTGVLYPTRPRRTKALEHTGQADPEWSIRIWGSGKRIVMIEIQN